MALWTEVPWILQRKIKNNTFADNRPTSASTNHQYFCDFLRVKQSCGVNDVFQVLYGLLPCTAKKKFHSCRERDEWTRGAFRENAGNVSGKQIRSQCLCLVHLEFGFPWNSHDWHWLLLFGRKKRVVWRTHLASLGRLVRTKGTAMVFPRSVFSICLYSSTNLCKITDRGPRLGSLATFCATLLLEKKPVLYARVLFFCEVNNNNAKEYLCLGLLW